MEEENNIDKVESDKNEPEDGNRKANPEKLITITKVPPKILARYLSGPMSSCHNRCKYGIKHEIEAKPWSPAHKRVKKRLITREKKTKVQEENQISLAGTRKSGSISKPSPTSKNGGLNSPVDIKEVINEKLVPSETNSQPFEETDVSLEHDNSGQSHDDECSEPSPLPVQEYSKVPTKRERVKNKNHVGSSSRKESKGKRKQNMTSSTGSKERSMPPSNSLSSKKHHFRKTSSLIANKTAKNFTGSSSVKNHENVKESKPEESSIDTIPEKLMHVIEPASPNLSEEPSLASEAPSLASKEPFLASEEPSLASEEPSLASEEPSLASKEHTFDFEGPTLASDEIKLSSPPSSSSGVKSLKHTISSKTRKSMVPASSRKGLRLDGHGTRPTLSVTFSHPSFGRKNKYTKSLSRVASISSVSSSKSSLGNQSYASFKSSRSLNSHQGEKVKVGYKIRPRMSTVVAAGNKALPPRMLTFRRGKVIEIQPQSNNIPRRLKFKPARLLGDGIKRDINSTRKRTDASEEVGDGELNAASIKYEKVLPKIQIGEGSKRRTVGKKFCLAKCKVDGSKQGSDHVILRHRFVQGKKQNPRLYNNVIEETASMLAEVRKSKVKALVGAFETVISLDSPREAISSEISRPC